MMSKIVKFYMEICDINGEVESRTPVFSKELTTPTHLKDLGLNHKEQINTLSNMIDSMLPHQINLIEADNKCQQCGGKTSKNGFVSSHFHTVFSDGSIILIDKPKQLSTLQRHLPNLFPKFCLQ